MHYILLYDYVENITEKRTPHRPGHLALINGYVERGEMILGGAYADPTDGAAFVFETEDRDRAQAFVDNDPYVAAGLVTNWKIRPWTVVAGTAL